MIQDNIVELAQPGEFCDAPTEALRLGVRTLLAQAVEAAVASFRESLADELTEDSNHRRLRHGHLPEREIATGIGRAGVCQPRVRDRVHMTPSAQLTVWLGPVYNHIVAITILTAYIIAANHAPVFS